MRKFYGDYLITYLSEPEGQARADVFRNGRRVEAHVSFPTGLEASETTEPYVVPLQDYARKEGFADHFHLILS